MIVTNRQRDALAILWDVLIPGDGQDWPTASRAIEDVPAALATLPDGDAPWLYATAARVADVAPADRVALLREIEAREPGAFARLIAWLYGAYYTTPLVHERVRVLAEAGPREASPHVDVSLLAQVIATQAGRRRV